MSYLHEEPLDVSSCTLFVAMEVSCQRHQILRLTKTHYNFLYIEADKVTPQSFSCIVLNTRC